MLRLIMATAGLLLMCCVMSSCDSAGESSKYAEDMPDEGPAPVRVDPIPAPGSDLEATSAQSGGGG